MIRLSRLDGREFVVNALLIETIEETPDTVITLTTGRKHVVLESVDDIMARVVAYHRTVGDRRLAGPTEV